MAFLERLKSLLRDPPPGMAFEISEAGIAAARIGARAELEFQPLKSGTLSVSPLKENVVDPDDFSMAVRTLAGGPKGMQAARRRKDVALILPDFSARITVLDFDSFPSDAKEQGELIRFRLKRSVPFDVESAAMSYWVQTAANKKVDVVVVMAPFEIVARYEAPFRAAGMNPGLVTTSSIAALELAPENGLSVMAKISGRVLTVLVRDKGVLKLTRCLELPSAELEDVEAVLAPTFVYVEDNLGGRPEKLMLCGFGARTDEAERRFQEELGATAEPLRSPLAVPGENNAGLLGYLRSIARNN
jgi:type IV pilus assembly protein PilM